MNATVPKHQVQNRNSDPSPHYFSSPKTLTFQKTNQSSPSTQPQISPELRNWLAEAQIYYDAVMRGATPPPARPDWDQFMIQWRWARGQLQGTRSPWEPLTHQGINPTAQVDPSGGQWGTQNNLVHTGPQAEIILNGEVTRDIWSNEIIFSVESFSGKVEVKKEIDNRWDPPEAVLLITYRDPANGSETRAFIHDFQDAKIKFRVWEKEQITNLTDQPGLFKAEIIDPDHSEENSPQSSIPGKLIDEENRHFLYDSSHGQCVEFCPEPSGSDSEGNPTTEYHEIYGDSRILTKPSGQVTISQGMPEDPGGYTVVITHRDGSFDIFYIHDGFHIELGANPKNINWGGREAEDGKVPQEFEKDINLLGGPDSEDPENGDEEPPMDPYFPQDGSITPPDRVETDPTTGEPIAIYNTSPDVELRANYEDEVHRHHVTAPGQVVLHGNDFSDTAKVEYDEAKRIWTIQFFPGGNPNADPEVFVIQGGLETEVILDLMGEDSLVDTTALAKDSVRIGLDSEEEDSPDSPASRLAQVEGIEMTAAQIEADEFILQPLPPMPNEELFEFLYRIDPVLQNLLDNYQGLSDQERPIGSQIRDRVVELLQALYPDQDVEIADWDQTIDPRMDDDIMWGNTRIDVVLKAPPGPSQYRGAGWLQFETEYEPEE